MGLKKDTNWILVPGTARDLDAVRERCLQLVRRRAMVSAGVAAVPIPGLDIISDMRLFANLIEDVNRHFGLSEEQIERMHPRFRMIAYQAAVGIGSMLVGKVVTREVVMHMLRRMGVKTAAKQAGKLVPLAGQLASAGIGFFAFRQIGYAHVEACVTVAQQLQLAGIADPGNPAHPAGQAEVPVDKT